MIEIFNTSTVKNLTRRKKRRQGHCLYRGELASQEPCSCGASSFVAVHRCEKHRLCCPHGNAAKIKGWEHATLPVNCDGCPDYAGRAMPFDHISVKPRYITTGQRVRDARKLAGMLPVDTAGIIGVARSGLAVAADVAMLLHLPLRSINQKTGVVSDLGNGSRLRKGRVTSSRWIVVDDTCMTGYSIEQIKGHIPNAEIAVLYWNPHAAIQGKGVTPDYYVHKYHWPHLLEWNLFNSVLVPHVATDMDGVLCEECPASHDDDGDRYAEFLSEARPLHLIRRCPVPLIVTARLEKYRTQTERWLSRHGVQFNRLEMFPHESRDGHCIGTWKGEIYSQWAEQHHASPGPHIFIESCPLQSRRISEASGRLVVCPTNGECFW